MNFWMRLLAFTLLSDPAWYLGWGVLGGKPIDQIPFVLRLAVFLFAFMEFEERWAAYGYEEEADG